MTVDQSPDEDRSRGDAIFRHIVESAREYAIFTTDREGRVTTWNAGAERAFGYEEAEILGRDARIIFTPEDRDRGIPEREMRAALDVGRGEDRRWHVRKDGSRFWADGYLMPLEGESDQAEGFLKVVRDRSAEARYRRSEERFRLLVESVTDYAIIMIDAEHRVASWNTGARRLLGYEEREALGRDARVIFTPEDRERGEPEREMETAAAEGRAENERWHVRKDGSRFWGSGMMMPLRDDPEGKPGFVKIFRDMTDQRRADAERERLLGEVEAQRERLDEVFRTSPSFMAVLRGPEHVFELVNDRYAQLVGHRELLGKPVREALPEIEGQGFFELLDHVYLGGEPFTGTSQRILIQLQPDRPPEELVVDFVYQPIREPGGSVSGVLAHGIDLTERKRAEEQLQESERRYRTLFDSMDQGYCVIEMLYDDRGRPADYRFIEVNPAFEGHTGLRGAAGRRIRELAPGLEAHWFEHYGRVAETGEPMRFEDEAAALGGRWFDVYAFRIGPPERRRVAVLFSDVTERKRLERSLRHRLRELAEADRRKDEFLAMLAHELRNPLASIHGAIRLLRRPGMEGHGPDALEVIERQAGNLARLIDDLLDVSRITQGKVELRREAVDVSAAIGRAAEAVRPLIEQRKHELTIRLPAGPLRVDADPTRLEQVIVNLLTNAAKYTEEGGHLAVSGGRQGDEAVVEVTDTGIGIDPDLLPTVFELFTQADRSLARSEGGLGIGLTLVRRLVELHGGAVSVQSEPGKGSAFTVRFPLLEATPEAATPSREPEVRGRGRRVLLVDDNADTARLTGWLLRSLGFDVQVVHDGRAAIEAAREFRPDAVLLDIGLPGMDGYEVARRLRRDECCRDAVFIAASGYGDEPARARGRAAGFDHHLVKPVDVEDIARLVGEARSPGP